MKDNASHYMAVIYNMSRTVLRRSRIADFDLLAVLDVSHNMIVNVGNNINRRDDTSGARYTAANGVLFTMSWNSLCIKAIKCSY